MAAAGVAVAGALIPAAGIAAREIFEVGLKAALKEATEGGSKWSINLLTKAIGLGDAFVATAAQHGLAEALFQLLTPADRATAYVIEKTGDVAKAIVRGMPAKIEAIQDAIRTMENNDIIRQTERRTVATMVQAFAAGAFKLKQAAIGVFKTLDRFASPLTETSFSKYVGELGTMLKGEKLSLNKLLEAGFGQDIIAPEKVLEGEVEETVTIARKGQLFLRDVSEGTKDGAVVRNLKTGTLYTKGTFATLGRWGKVMRPGLLSTSVERSAALGLLVDDDGKLVTTLGDTLKQEILNAPLLEDPADTEEGLRTILKNFIEDRQAAAAFATEAEKDAEELRKVVIERNAVGDLLSYLERSERQTLEILYESRQSYLKVLQEIDEAAQRGFSGLTRENQTIVRRYFDYLSQSLTKGTTVFAKGVWKTLFGAELTATAGIDFGKDLKAALRGALEQERSIKAAIGQILTKEDAERVLIDVIQQKDRAFLAALDDESNPFKRIVIDTLKAEVKPFGLEYDAADMTLLEQRVAKRATTVYYEIQRNLVSRENLLSLRKAFGSGVFQSKLFSSFGRATALAAARNFEESCREAYKFTASATTFLKAKAGNVFAVDLGVIKAAINDAQQEAAETLREYETATLSRQIELTEGGRKPPPFLNARVQTDGAARNMDPGALSQAPPVEQTITDTLGEDAEFVDAPDTYEDAPGKFEDASATVPASSPSSTQVNLDVNGRYTFASIAQEAEAAQAERVYNAQQLGEMMQKAVATEQEAATLAPIAAEVSDSLTKSAIETATTENLTTSSGVVVRAPPAYLGTFTNVKAKLQNQTLWRGFVNRLYATVFPRLDPLQLATGGRLTELIETSVSDVVSKAESVASVRGTFSPVSGVIAAGDLTAVAVGETRVAQGMLSVSSKFRGLVKGNVQKGLKFLIGDASEMSRVLSTANLLESSQTTATDLLRAIQTPASDTLLSKIPSIAKLSGGTVEITAPNVLRWLKDATSATMSPSFRLALFADREVAAIVERELLQSEPELVKAFLNQGLADMSIFADHMNSDAGRLLFASTDAVELFGKVGVSDAGDSIYNALLRKTAPNYIEILSKVGRSITNEEMSDAMNWLIEEEAGAFFKSADLRTGVVWNVIEKFVLSKLPKNAARSFLVTITRILRWQASRDARTLKMVRSLYQLWARSVTLQKKWEDASAKKSDYQVPFISEVYATAGIFDALLRDLSDDTIMLLQKQALDVLRSLGITSVPANPFAAIQKVFDIVGSETPTEGILFNGGALGDALRIAMMSEANPALPLSVANKISFQSASIVDLTYLPVKLCRYSSSLPQEQATFAMLNSIGPDMLDDAMFKWTQRFDAVNEGVRSAILYSTLVAGLVIPGLQWLEILPEIQVVGTATSVVNRVGLLDMFTGTAYNMGFFALKDNIKIAILNAVLRLADDAVYKAGMTYSWFVDMLPNLRFYSPLRAVLAQENAQDLRKWKQAFVDFLQSNEMGLAALPDKSLVPLEVLQIAGDSAQQHYLQLMTMKDFVPLPNFADFAELYARTADVTGKVTFSSEVYDLKTQAEALYSGNLNSVAACCGMLTIMYKPADLYKQEFPASVNGVTLSEMRTMYMWLLLSRRVAIKNVLIDDKFTWRLVIQ